MSTWIEIKKQEDVDYDMVQDTVCGSIKVTYSI